MPTEANHYHLNRPPVKLSGSRTRLPRRIAILDLALFTIGVSGLLFWWIRMLPVLQVMLRPRSLTRVNPVEWANSSDAPTVSVIVPACNEGPNIEACLRTLLAQDYPRLEIIAVNDRSTDNTGSIMNRLSGDDARLRVLHVSELPPGWLGKNHANHSAALTSSGEWLLFTDGDIHFEQTVISRAITHAAAESLDHLTLFPGLIGHAAGEKAACCLFGLMFSAKLRPWRVRDPLVPDAFCGIGAFNLVRKSAYHAVGGHQRLRLEVADDVKLGKLIKAGGFVSDILAGWPLIRVRWQIGLIGIIRGLEKNAFAAAEFQTIRMTLMVLLLTALAIGPLIGAVLAPGWIMLPFALLALSQMVALGLGARQQGFSAWIGLLFPIACLTLAIAACRSMLLALYRGGVSWRGTIYSLDELKRGIV